MKRLLSGAIFLMVLCLALPSRADFNLINIDMGSPEGQKLTNLYGNAYGYSPMEVAPAMMAPAQEVPGILQLAKAAGTLPLSIWMMRKLGMSYSDIVTSYALSPATLGGFGPGYGAPSVGFGDSVYIQNSQNYFLRNILQISDKYIPSVPLTGVAFSRAVLFPYDPVNGWWLPPGIAQKYGIWVPPGQIGKIGPGYGPQIKVIHHKKWKEKKWKHKKFKGKKHKGWR